MLMKIRNEQFAEYSFQMPGNNDIPDFAFLQADIMQEINEINTLIIINFLKPAQELNDNINYLMLCDQIHK